MLAGLGVALAVARAAKRHDRRPFTLLERIAVAAFAAASVRQFGWIVYESGGVLLTVLRYNYGDLPLHWTYIRHIAGGASFWPQNPVFASERLLYPLGVDLLTAVFVQLGAGLPVVLRVTGVVCALLTALALRRWGGGFAVAAFLCSGGLAGFRILVSGRLVDYQAAVEWKNLFLTLFVPQRGFLLALPVGLLLLCSWRRRLLRDEPGLPAWVEGLLWGTLPLLHLHSFAFVSLMFAVWTLGGCRWRAVAVTLALAVPPATWAVWQVTGGFRAASFVGLSPGWTIGGANPLVFLLLNFGLFLPLALGALVVAIRGRQREQLLVLAPALAMFGLLFVFRVAPWAWDNTKVMVWCYLAALPAIETLVLAHMQPVLRAATVVVFLFSGAESVVAASAGREQRLDVLELAEYEGVCRALAPLGPDERVATAQVHNHPVALCGQPLVAGYGGHLWSHGISSAPVEVRLGRLLDGTDDYREHARALGTRHLFWGLRERVAHPASRRPWEQSGPPLASGPWGALYRLD